MKNVIIAGAGPAGLTAAYELLKDNDGKYKVTILEESNCIGGISRTVVHNSKRMDIGGHRFFSKNEEIVKWWLNFMPLQGSPSFDDRILGREKTLATVGPDPDKEDRVMLTRHRVSRIYYLNKFFDYPISLKPQTFINMGLKRTVKAGTAYLSSCVHKREEKSLEDFYINRFGKTLYSMFFEGYTEKLWGRHPGEIDPSWGAQRTKNLSVTAVIKDAVSKILHINHDVETSLIEEYYYPKLGPGQLWELVAQEVQKLGGEIIMNSPVTAVNGEKGKITSVLCNDKKYDCDIFVSSMPVKDLVSAFTFEVPEDKKEIAEGLPYRDFVTVGLLLDRLNLKNETNIKTLGNIIPDCWIYVQDVGVKLGRIQIFNNWSPYLVDRPDKKIWIGLEYFCSENDDFWNMTEEECVKFAVNELVEMGVIDNDAEVFDSHRERVKKAYPAYFDTYDRMDELVAYLDDIDNLYCIGRNGQHRYNNMDHSMLTAIEAVKVIKGENDNKEIIWKVNTEKEYHEEKK